MPIKTQIDALLKEKMDRKDFLKYAGTVTLGVIGITGLLRMILGTRGILPEENNAPKSGGGYGSSRYGQ